MLLVSVLTLSMTTAPSTARAEDPARLAVQLGADGIQPGQVDATDTEPAEGSFTVPAVPAPSASPDTPSATPDPAPSTPEAASPSPSSPPAAPAPTSPAPAPTSPYPASPGPSSTASPVLPESVAPSPEPRPDPRAAAADAEPPVAVLALPDPENPTAVLDITKSGSDVTIGPGNTLVYTISVGCSAITDVGCRDAITTDVVPEPFVIVRVTPSGPNAAAEPEIDGQSVTVSWTQVLSAGVIGMLDNTTSQVEITVQLPEDVSYDFNGVTVTNQAVAEATNALDIDDSVPVTINVPLDLDTSATKAFEPEIALAAPGTPVTATLTGSNDSNATVDTLVIQDPVDPTATPNPFTLLGFTGFGEVTPPAGATETTYEVYVDGAWIEAPGGVLPDDVAPEDVQGTRVTFTGAIPPGETATVTLDLETTDAAADLTEDTTVTNDVQSTVSLGDQDAAGEDSADFTLQANDVSVAATKEFDPDLVIAGESSTVTLGARNTSPFPIDSLTITEPSSGSFPPEYTFAGFTGGIDYPSGADSGTVIYQPSGEEVPFGSGEIPASPTPPESVTSFQIVFACADEVSCIQPGGEASIPFDVATDPDLADLPTTVTNEVGVAGENDGATDDTTEDADLHIYDEVIEPYVDKQIRPSQIVAEPGQLVTVTLQGGTTERPDPPDTPTGSTGNADQIVIQDPMDPVEGDLWWNAFDLEAITQTPIPADSTLTIYYYDTTTGEWVLLDGPIAGEAIYSSTVPADVSEVAGGIRFVYDYTGDAGGFPPGTDLAPNFTSTLRDEGRYDGAAPPFNTDPDLPPTVIPNCAQSSATSPTPGVPGGSTGMDPATCPDIDIIPPGSDGGGDGGVGDLVSKEFGTSSSGGIKSVIARSADTIPSTLSWSTGGYSGLETVQITDVADPAIPVADSVFDAFDLVEVLPITDADDPYLTYDQVTGVQLWNGTAFVDATNDPCPAACDGTFPGVELTATEQETTQSIRLVFAESPTRADRIEGDLDAPPVGSGVARSLGNGRHITLVWQVRDTRRSTGVPVLAEELYNLADPGIVRNTVNATGFPAEGDPVSDTASDDVLIIDVPITTTTDKVWLGGPLALPEPGTPDEDYPRSRIRVTTVNTTPANVDQLSISDPAGSPATDPFDIVQLVRIAGITVPGGTIDTTVTLTCPGGTTVDLTLSAALALTPDTMPCDVIGVQVLFDGRIASGAQGVLAMDVRLRADHRETGEPVTLDDSPVANGAEGIVADVDAIQDCPPEQGARYACAEDAATIEIVAPTFGIIAGKTISPASQVEGDYSPVTVTLSAQNSGSVNPYYDTITDDDPTFWNAVDLLRMDPSWVLPQPVTFVRGCYLAGGDFTAANVEADTVGGTWTCQELPPGPPFQPGDLTLAEARDFIDTAAQTMDVHGVRFQFMAASQIGWQNPANPLIQVPFQVERRTDLRTGGPVPTTRSDQTAAPGEEEAGVFVDTVEVEGVSVLIGPDTRLEAADTADAPYTHEHLTVGVYVEKGPSGQVQPGRAFPYTLTYKNTGESPLTAPVFTDVLPTDAEGPQLIFDPDTDATSTSPYGFALAEPPPDPPNGDPLPTDQDQITITEAPDRITFAMPAGSVLEPGQIYTITIQLMLRPGLTPDDLVTNTATVIADEPFDPDACTPNFDAQTGECWDDTTVSPSRVAALRAIKGVRADVPVDEPGIPEVVLDRDSIPAGVEVPDDYCDTAADPDGFHRAPCLPVTYPGDTETWRFTVTNAGTLPLNAVISIDSLPVPGDTGVIVSLPRNSAWEPTFAGGIELITDNPTASLTVSYTPDHDPCTADIQTGGGVCEVDDWLPYDDTVDATQVGSLRFVVQFGADLFEPGEQLSLQFQTRTTPGAQVATDFPPAWNTVATGGQALDGGTTSLVVGTEGRKAGVTYPTGPIQLQKLVTGAGAGFAPDAFVVQLTCTSEGTALADLPEVTLVPGADPVQLDGLPWGAQCTATETDQGQTSQVIGTATVGGPDDSIGLVTVTNTFDVGDVSVTKTVTSEAVDQAGNPISYGPFGVAAACQFLGGPVYAEGFGPENPMRTQLSDGQTWTLTGLPVGAVCTITEPDPADAAVVTITPETVEVGGDEVVQVEVENAYDVGSLHLRKLVLPEGVEQFPVSQGPFTLHVACTLTDASHPDGEVVYEANVVLQGAQPLEATIDNIATGAVCVITEPDPGAATVHVITPGTVTIGADDTANVVATNLFGRGALAVTKVIDGPGAELYGAGPFQVSLNCSYTNVSGGQVPLITPGGSTRTLSAENGYRAVYDPLLYGSTCRISETQTGGATSSVITDADGQAVTEIRIDSLTEQVQLTATNTFDVGSISVVKSVVGEGPDAFEVSLTCTRDVDGTATPVAIPGGPTRTLAASGGFTATYDLLPVGAVCTLVETDDGGASSTTITPNAGDPLVGSVTVADGATVSLSVQNTFDPDPPPAPPAPPDPPGPPDESGGLLPPTGAGRALLGLLVAGLVLIGVGGLLSRRGRLSTGG